ncbi:MAG: hypothetical protein QOF30_3610 [Acidimicrobiaceae bacterium]|jgi:hypothetical protein|nr:hypothetical protein [Acidimicrobiaceae bacterium]
MPKPYPKGVPSSAPGGLLLVAGEPAGKMVPLVPEMADAGITASESRL